MTDRLLVNGLALFCHCGISAEERAVGQRLVVDLEIGVGLGDEVRNGGLDTTVDYAAVCRDVCEIGGKARHVLLEALAVEIADAVLAYSRVEDVRVRVTKPTPPIDPSVASFGVEIVRNSVRRKV